MEIIRRKNEGHKFKVMRSFLHGGKALEPGAEVELQEPEASGYVVTGRAYPTDIPAIGKYLCVRPFYLPGKEKKHEAKPGETLLIKSEDAIDLLIQGAIIPKDSGQWRPYRRLASQDE